MNIKKDVFSKFKAVVVMVLSIATLTACGGGSSSSGGGTVFTPILFSGTYQTPVYSGSLTIRLVSETSATVQLTGIDCLQQEFTMNYSLSGSNYNISNNIPGQPDNAATGAPAQITMLWPTGGGDGTIILDPGANCIPSEGTINLTRS